MAVRPTAIRNSCRRTSKQGWFRLPRRSRSMACSLSQALLGQSNNHKRKREDDMLKSVHRMLAVAAVSLAALAAGPSVAAEFITVGGRSDEHTSELPSLMRTSYSVFCLNKIN